MAEYIVRALVPATPGREFLKRGGGGTDKRQQLAAWTTLKDEATRFASPEEAARFCQDKAIVDCSIEPLPNRQEKEDQKRLQEGAGQPAQAAQPVQPAVDHAKVPPGGASGAVDSHKNPDRVAVHEGEQPRGKGETAEAPQSHREHAERTRKHS